MIMDSDWVLSLSMVMIQGCLWYISYANTVVVEMRRTVSVTLATVTVNVTPAALNPLGATGTMARGPGACTVRVDVGTAADGTFGIAKSVEELVGMGT